MAVDAPEDKGLAPAEIPDGCLPKAAAVAALLFLFFLSGERESELRARLEGERTFSASVADEANEWVAKSENESCQTH